MSEGGPPRVLVHAARPEALLDLVQAAAPQAEIATCADNAGLAEVLDRARPQVVLSYKFPPGPFPAAALAACPSVCWVQVGGAGCDHLQPWDPERLTVTNASGTQSEVMSDLALCGLYMLNLQMPTLLRQQAERQWQPQVLRASAGQRVCVVGCGRLGRAIAGRMQAVGVHTVGVATRARTLPGFDRVYAVDALHTALAESDAAVVVLPLTAATRGLIDAAALAALPAGAHLINLSRGGIVDEAALLDALDAGHLAGALLDVFATEPLPADSRFWQHPRVVVTPHNAAIFEGWERAAAALFADNLRRWQAGAALGNVVDPARGY